MARTIKICTIQPEGGRINARPSRGGGDEVATKERVDNVRVTPLDVAASGRQRAAVERLKLWDTGRRLRVSFLDGIQSVQQRVAAIAKEWEAVANLRLDFVASGAAEIRISFADEGFSWSTVGTDALTVPRSQATMNYGWLEPDTSQREYERVVRHEFGHALGMIHEHQNSDAQGKIPWDRPAVYAHYARQGWSRADVDQNLFDVYDADLTNFTSFDPTSIMQYAVPDSLTVGSFAIGWNTALSDQDRSFMSTQYPSSTAGTVELEVGATPHAADLAGAGEIDTYRFDVPAAATHIMATQGTIDTVLTLHGPDDAGAVLAWDDDRGAARNARIVRKLHPGTYWLSVRHGSTDGTGPYTIGIKTRRS